MTSFIIERMAFMSPSSSMLCVLLLDRVMAASPHEHASSMRMARLDGTCSSLKPWINLTGQLILMDPAGTKRDEKEEERK